MGSREPVLEHKDHALGDLVQGDLGPGRGGLWKMGSTGLRLEREGGSGEHGLEHEELVQEELGLEPGHKELGLKHHNLKDLAHNELEHEAHEDCYSVIFGLGNLVATW